MATKAEVQAALEDALAKPAVLDRIVERLLDRKLGEDALGRDYALGARLRQTHVTTTRTLEITKDLAQLAADSGLSEEDRKALAADIAARVDRVTVTVEEGT